MKQYDIKCPCCGTVNKGLYLDETGGWMICEHCHAETMDGEYARQHSVRLPLLTMSQLAHLETICADVLPARMHLPSCL